MANRELGVRERHPRIGGLILALGEAPQHETAWVRGAVGEEHVGAFLEKHLEPGTALLNDRSIPRSRANIDHIAIAPSGVWVVDSKRYKGKVAVSNPLFGQSKLTIAGRDRSKLVDGLRKQVQLVAAAIGEIAPGATVHGALCFIDADLPVLGQGTFKGYALLYPKPLARRINAGGPLGSDDVRAIATVLARRFPSA